MTEPVVLVACSDDYLLEEALANEVRQLSASPDQPAVIHLPDDVTPERAAMELVSPSLFDPARVLVVADVRGWMRAKAPAGGPGAAAPADPEPLVEALAAGVPEGVGLVLGAWCGGKPTGPLVDAVRAAGRVEWIALPRPPKPWEDVALSSEQVTVLREVLQRAAAGVRWTPGAERLLLERLGFAPRLLAQEVRKLASACGSGASIDEELVRRLTFPPERSLEAVRDAVLHRELKPLVDLLAAAEAGIVVRDWRGQALGVQALPAVLLGQVCSLLQQLLYVRRTVAALGEIGELDPARTGRGDWYSRSFKGGGLGERILKLIDGDPASPYAGKKNPSLWSLGRLAAGAGRYREEELVRALASAGRVEADLRREAVGVAAMTAWLTDALQGAAP